MLISIDVIKLIKFRIERNVWNFFPVIILKLLQYNLSLILLILQQNGYTKRILFILFYSVKCNYSNY